MKIIKRMHHMHIVKAFTWRLLASLTTFIIGWFITGDIVIGALIGGIEATVKIVLYYGHERAWFYYQQHHNILS